MAPCQAWLLPMGATKDGKVHVQARGNVSPLSAIMHLVAANVLCCNHVTCLHIQDKLQLSQCAHLHQLWKERGCVATSKRLEGFWSGGLPCLLAEHHSKLLMAFQ